MKPKRQQAQYPQFIEQDGYYYELVDMEYVVTTKEKFDAWVKKEDDEYEEKIREWKERVKE